MKNENRLVPYAEFLTICHSAKDQFAFLESIGFRLAKEQWPSGDSFKDGFQLTYTRSPVSITVEYYDMELVIWFEMGQDRVSYLFVDHELMGNRSGFAGCMFPRDRLSDAMTRMAEDTRLNYGPVLSGELGTWKRLITLSHAPRKKQRLP